jgi:hypothetical protein
MLGIAAKYDPALTLARYSHVAPPHLQAVPSLAAPAPASRQLPSRRGYPVRVAAEFVHPSGCASAADSPCAESEREVASNTGGLSAMDENQSIPVKSDGEQ